MLDHFREFLVVLEEGNISRAAARIRVSQSTLSRQMQALEAHVGGKLLEREHAGVRATALGHHVARAMRPLLEDYEKAVAELRRAAKGNPASLRIGYLISAAGALLEPALARLRKTAPGVKVQIQDLSPRQQLEALARGELDVAMIGQEGALAARQFHCARLCSLPVCAAVAVGDPLATRRSVALRELRGRDFVGVDEHHMPGRNRWILQLGRAAGFRPRISAVVDGITHVLSHIASESSVTLLPGYFMDFRHPGVAYVTISDSRAKWEFLLLWQKGGTSQATRALLDALRAEGAELEQRLEKDVARPDTSKRQTHRASGH